MSNLRCPWCGLTPWTNPNGLLTCANGQCPGATVIAPPARWNNRALDPDGVARVAQVLANRSEEAMMKLVDVPLDDMGEILTWWATTLVGSYLGKEEHDQAGGDPRKVPAVPDPT
jgi:hypothetical protein